MIVAITAFVPIHDHPRSEDEYHHLAAPLYQLAFEAPIMVRMDILNNCWLFQYLLNNYKDYDKITYSVADNPQKNSLEYHIVQAQKTNWLVEAAEALDMQPDVYVWIDYGIFHVPGVTPQIIKDFLERVEGEQTIAIPGCWDRDYQYDDNYPCWRFCGGVMVVPRKHLLALDLAMKHEYVLMLDQQKQVTWEVNVLARVEKRYPELPIWWYKADHDASLFTAYRAGESSRQRH